MESFLQFKMHNKTKVMPNFICNLFKQNSITHAGSKNLDLNYHVCFRVIQYDKYEEFSTGQIIISYRGHFTSNRSWKLPGQGHICTKVCCTSPSISLFNVYTRFSMIQNYKSDIFSTNINHHIIKLNLMS